MLHALILPPQWYRVPVHLQLAAIVLKALIIILLIGVLVSLFTGLTFLFQDTGRPNSKRTWYALGVRVTLATALVLTMSYGFYTGELKIGSNAPWHHAIHDEANRGDAGQ
jgi:quinol-cytochrome oxidoreductase complex cytochrome b subunit